MSWETTKIVQQLREALGPEGMKFFRDVYKKYGKIGALWLDGEGPMAIPHSVHFREGMIIRNILRKITDYSWTAHEYDDRWEGLTEEAIRMSMYSIIELDNGTYQCICRVQDGVERWTEETKEKAERSLIGGAKAMNGAMITKDDIHFEAYC